MNKTLEAFDDIYAYIEKFEGALQEGEDYGYAYGQIIDIINDLLEHNEISERVAQKYFEIMNELKNHPYDMVDELKTLTNSYIDKSEDADKKLKDALDWHANTAEYVDKQNDSKPTQNLLNDLISKYDNEYYQLGELESVDALCVIGTEVKKALDENKISRKTADALMESLQEMGDNLFNKDLHDEKIKELRGFLTGELSNEKGKEAEASVVGRGVQRVTDAIANGIQKHKDKQAPHVPKEDKKDDRFSGFNLGMRPKEHEEKAKDIVQNSADDKRKLDAEVQQQDKAADKQNLKKQEPQVPQKPKEKEPENNLEKLDSLVKKYGDAYARIGSVVDPEHGDELLQIKNEIAATIDEITRKKEVSPEVAGQMREGLNYMVANSLHAGRHTDGLRRIGEITGREIELKSKTHGREKQLSQFQHGAQYQGFGQEKPMRSQHRDGDYLGFGRRVGRDMDAGFKEHKELSGAEKTNKFKDAIVNVLNKREAEQHAAQMKEKEAKDNAREAQEKALIKKLFMKTNND